jgi:hypothetical protein
MTFKSESETWFEQFHLSRAALKLKSSQIMESELTKPMSKPQDSVSVTNHTSNMHDLPQAHELYNKVKDLIENTKPLDEYTARMVVEYSDDAIKEFGTTNQDKKVELREWKAEAELVLPPATIEELRKRAEGQFLDRGYPRKKILRDILLWVIGLGIVAGTLFGAYRAFVRKDPKSDNSSNNKPPATSTPDPHTPTPADNPGPLVKTIMPNSGAAEGGNTVRIFGNGFTNDTKVFFDGLPAEILEVPKEHSIHVRVPAHAAGVVDVLVSKPKTNSRPQVTYTYNP